jgi:hypothetical protein
MVDTAETPTNYLRVIGTKRLRKTPSIPLKCLDVVGSMQLAKYCSFTSCEAFHGYSNDSCSFRPL